MMTTVDSEAWRMLLEKMGQVDICSESSIPECKISPTSPTRKRKSSTILVQDFSKALRNDPMMEEMLPLQDEEEELLTSTDKNFVCRLVELFPVNSLAAVSKTFCEASYLMFRRKIPDKPFTRAWKYSWFEEDGSWVDPFSANLHYHPALLRSQKEIVPPVRKVQSIITFVTDEASDIVYSIQLPLCTILGSTNKIVFRSDCHDVQFADNERCFSSLFIPESDHFYLKTFSLPVEFSNRHLSRVTTLKGKSEAFPLKALFILQYNYPPIFHANYFPLASDVVVNGGIMSIASSSGPDQYLAIGFSIFADWSVYVRLYGCDFSDTNDFVFLKMQEDLMYKRHGFCIFMWCDSLNHKYKSESWETSDDDAKVNPYDLEYEAKKAATNESVSRVLKKFKTLFPQIPLIGCSSSHVMFHNGFQLSAQVNASFLVVAC